MPITTHTLIMACKAVSIRVSELTAQLRDAEDPDLYLLESELHEYEKAEMELRDTYVAIQKNSDNLPPYEQLVE